MEPTPTTMGHIAWSLGIYRGKTVSRMETTFRLLENLRQNVLFVAFVTSALFRKKSGFLDLGFEQDRDRSMQVSHDG
jgi:hypothetical protein